MRGSYIGLPEIMAALFTSFDWCFLSCIFSGSIDIAASGFSAKACIFTGFFSKSGGFTYEGFSIWKPLL
ncbi:hypothetical protein [Pseudobacteroides cellulosolvens]|uniref:hypothetical protein n=1 Tax=Pseudobacteroides cellulosolvens TaxID=35825 RepID=UPI0006834940|nr:hypothetical protein [Pseudobacteroides cellulosolvens]